MICVEYLEHMITELRVLKLSLNDALFAKVPLRRPDHGLNSHLFDMLVFWRVLRDLWRVRLACMAILPSVSTCSVEAGGFDR